MFEGRVCYEQCYAKSRTILTLSLWLGVCKKGRTPAHAVDALRKYPKTHKNKERTLTQGMHCHHVALHYVDRESVKKLAIFEGKYAMSSVMQKKIHSE